MSELMFLTDIPEGKKIRGIICAASNPKKYQANKSTVQDKQLVLAATSVVNTVNSTTVVAKGKVLHLYILKNKKLVNLMWPASLPFKLYHLFFDEITDELHPSMLNRQIQIQRNKNNDYLVQCDEVVDYKKAWTFWQQLRFKAVVNSLEGVIKILKKTQVTFKNPLNIEHNLFDDITQLELVHKNLANFIKQKY